MQWMRLPPPPLKWLESNHRRIFKRVGILGVRELAAALQSEPFQLSLDSILAQA
jgi:hypothetical protein